MTHQPQHGSPRGLMLAVMAALGGGCSDGTTPEGLHVSGPCATYGGGTATPASLAGSYTVVSYCQNAQPLSGPAGSLAMTASPDSLRMWVNRGRLSPVTLTGPYTVSGDTITVTAPASFGSFFGTYAFVVDTLYMSGRLWEGRLSIAIVAIKK